MTKSQRLWAAFIVGITIVLPSSIIPRPWSTGVTAFIIAVLLTWVEKTSIRAGYKLGQANMVRVDSVEFTYGNRTEL
jgi:hypothetical protein